MNMPLKIVKIGNSAGVILPKDVLARLGVTAGETVNASLTERGVELVPLDDDFETQMAVARGVMQSRRRALRELAK